MLRVFVLSCVLLLPAGLRAQDAVSPEDKLTHTAHERLLAEHKLPTSGPALLNFFRERTLSKDQVEKINGIIEQLNTPVYGVRAMADAELSRVVRFARPVIKHAVADTKNPLEARRRLELLLKNHPDDLEPALAEATAFFIARHKPDGAAKVLLDYLPFASHPQIVTAIRETLPAVALRDGKPEPIIQNALKDTHALKRALAGEALVRAGGLTFKPKVKHLLSDEHKQVRWHVLQALVESKDKDAIPAVIELIDDLDKDRAWEVEDLLCRIAGDKGPGVYLGAAEPPAKLEKAWMAWWAKNEADIDLARLTTEPPLIGNTLVTQMVPGKGLVGKVTELNPSKEVIWEIEGLRYPVDAQIISPDRVLIAEYFSRRITERDFKGNIHWEKPIDMPIHCQRLPNGHTFIASRRQLLLVDREGKELFSHFSPATSICAAQRLRNGQMFLVDSTGILKHLDQHGKELNSFKVGQVYAMGGNIEVLSGGRILVPAYRENRIIEYNWEGKELWSAHVNQPISATRLPGGNTLVVSLGQLRVVEIDRHGKEVSTLSVEGRPWRARKR